MVRKIEVLVIGAGPGGYSAAFRAADLGKQVLLVDKNATLGGVCLNVGCIPSKALLHIAKVIDDSKDMATHGVTFSEPKIDLTKVREFKNQVIAKLTGGLAGLAKQRKVEVLRGTAIFKSANTVEVTTEKGEKELVEFTQAIIAAGSRPVALPFLPEDERILDSTSALELKNTKGKLLVIGGGIIGLEMATVYHALGAEITVVEFLDQLIAACDADIVMPLQKRIQSRYENIYLKTKVVEVTAKKDGLWVKFEGEQAPKELQRFDQILCAVGRKPNGDLLQLDAAGVKADARGFIQVDKQLRTSQPHIFAIGDIIGNPMLAHKAVHEGHVAAEVVAGHKREFDPRCIPSVAYTDPEIAWVGVTEKEAKEKKMPYTKAVFPWAASGRALANARAEGFTKLIIDEKTERVMGGAIVGVNAGELIAEIGLAIEMGCDVEDLALTIHPHPTVSESVGLAAEIFAGTITDLYMPKKKKA